MNRHHKFYAELEAALEDDEYDDYYDEDEEEYYEEEQGEYDEAEDGAAAPQEAAPVVRRTSIHPDTDPDYDLLNDLLTVLDKRWSTEHPLEIPFPEEERVSALRGSNYDADGACATLYRDRLESKKNKGPKVLKVVGTGKNDKRKDDPSEEGGMEEEDTSASGTGVSSSVTLSKGKNSNKYRKSVELLKPDPTKPDCTFIIAGHVDAGKSTTLGHLLLLLGKVDVREVEKNAKDSKGTHKESFKYAWLLDQSEEERRRGVTIDSGSYCFETPHRRVHVLDAPGHKDYVLSMMSSATQADAAILIVNAAPSEFETGLANGTKEHLIVLKTLGVGSIVVAVNKMDAAGFSEERYQYIVRELKLLFKQLVLNESVIQGFVPISGMGGVNLVTPAVEELPWYTGGTLVDLLDSCPLESRLLDAPLRLSLQDLRDGTVYCKVESGTVVKGDTLHFMPADVTLLVRSIEKPTVGALVDAAFAGEVVELQTNSPLVGLYPGNVGCELGVYNLHCSTDIEVHLQTFELLRQSMLPGSSYTLVLHALTVPVKVLMLVSKMNNKGEWSKGMVKCVPAKAQAIVVLRCEQKIVAEPAVECRALGRFILQQDGETVAGGLVRRVVQPY